MSSSVKPPNQVETIVDASMAEVSKDMFFEGMVLPVSVYLRISQDSYLMIGKQNDKALFANLHAYNNPKSHVYVKTVDHPALIAYVMQLTGKIINQKGVPDSTKLKFLTSLTTDAYESLEKSGFTSTAKIQRVANMAQQLSQNVKVFDELITVLADLHPAESKHAMTTCLISLLLSDEMHMNQAGLQEKLALGSLLHDVGLKFVPRSILDKPRHAWTAEELAVYEQHPIKGAEMLREIRDLPQDVLLIIAEHHETATGTGFPKKIRDVKMSPLARIVSLANNFANLLFGSLTDSKCYTPDEAVQYIEDIQGQPYNKQVFLALKNIINKKHLEDKSSS